MCCVHFGKNNQFGLQHRAMGEGGRKVGSREELVNYRMNHAAVREM